MKKPPPRAVAPAAPAATLAARAAEALRQERFKEAVDLFKQLIKQEPRPDWKESLADAYRGRARALAAKKMFKEAAIVLENTLAPDGTLQDSLFYLHCLLRDGQMPKAAAHSLLYIGPQSRLPTSEATALEALTAALLVAVPLRADPGRAVPPERARWLELAACAREALAAWVAGASPEAMEPLLNRISLRSAFRSIRLLLKTLADAPPDAERAQRLLEAIPPGSPFAAFREAVEAALLAGRALDVDGWQRLSPGQQAFVAETRGLPPSAVQFLARSAEAARGGPAALFGFLLKQNDHPRDDVRSACLNLLPQIPDRLGQFEKSFGPLPAFDRNRIQALAAEARGDWDRAEQHWRNAIDSTADPSDRQIGLTHGVIFRHLAQLARQHREIRGDGDPRFDNPVISYLVHACQADPEYAPAVIDLIGEYRAEPQPKDWHRLADDAARRFPDNSAVLLQATESAMARRAYKKAAGYAHRLLKIDPINPGVRRQMIELQVAHARKQMRAARADLAVKELAAAAEWERPDAPSAPLRIARALVDLHADRSEQAWERLRQGVALAGEGVAGWLRAVLEAAQMKLSGREAKLAQDELTRARATPPTREAVMAVVAVLGQPDVSEAKQAVVGVLFGLRAWLLQAATLDWSAAEFEAVAEMLARFEAFDLLHEYARAARGREPGNPIWRFHDIVARTRNNAAFMSMDEGDDLEQMIDAATAREDFRTVARIERFLDGEGGGPAGRRRPTDDLADDSDAEELDDAVVLFEKMLGDMPKGAADNLRAMVRDLGLDGALAQMIDQFRTAPEFRGMPAALVRMLCESLLTRAVGSGRPGQGASQKGRV